MGHREADLRLCFRICKKPVFSRRGSFHSYRTSNRYTFSQKSTISFRKHTQTHKKKKRKKKFCWKYKFYFGTGFVVEQFLANVKKYLLIFITISIKLTLLRSQRGFEGSNPFYQMQELMIERKRNSSIAM